MVDPIGVSGNGSRRLLIYPEGTDLTPTDVTLLEPYRMIPSSFYRGDPVAVADVSEAANWWMFVQSSAGFNSGERASLPAAEAAALITAARAVSV